MHPSTAQIFHSRFVSCLVWQWLSEHYIFTYNLLTKRESLDWFLAGFVHQSKIIANCCPQRQPLQHPSHPLVIILDCLKQLPFPLNRLLDFSSLSMLCEAFLCSYCLLPTEYEAFKNKQNTQRSSLLLNLLSFYCLTLGTLIPQSLAQGLVGYRLNKHWTTGWLFHWRTGR